MNPCRPGPFLRAYQTAIFSAVKDDTDGVIAGDGQIIAGLFALASGPGGEIFIGTADPELDEKFKKTRLL